MKQTLHIDNWHPVSANILMNSHWAAAQRLKDADMQMVGVYANKQGITKAEVARLLEVIITLGKGQKACDPDNYNKSLLDALVRTKLLVDDSRIWLEMPPIKFLRGNKAITITLTDIEELPPKWATDGMGDRYTARPGGRK